MNNFSIDDMKNLYKKGIHKELAKQLPYFQNSNDSFIKFLFNSNLLYMGESIQSLKSTTLGADPEFILIDKKTKEVVLFSSLFTNDYFGMSEIEIGADYGLLEFRPGVYNTSEELSGSIVDLYERFEKNFGNEDLEILEQESILFNHKRKRILETMENKEKEISYGFNRGKDVGVWSPGSDSDIIVTNELVTTFSAYDRSVFPIYNDELLTAGGHIHIGGTFVKMLSFPQLQLLVRNFDEEILPMCVEVESKFGELRRSVYGQKGEFRIKDYGIEYRSPSNAIFWKKNLSKFVEVVDKMIDISENIALI